MNFKFNLFLFLFISFSCLSHSYESLEEVDDNKFLHLCQTEKYVVVLFSKPDCKECDAIEEELILIRENLVDSLNAWVVKLLDSDLMQLYSTKAPALVFIREGVPLLYHGDIDNEVILHTFIENIKPVVKELNDSNFEHLTQASTGATTGDWFVLFYSKTCAVSQSLTATWEAVGAAFHRKLNVARINILESGSATARRFGVYSTPTFIFFHHGKMYKYNSLSYEVEALVQFASAGYMKGVKAETVPPPKSTFDDLTQIIADYIAENNWIIALGGFGVMIGFALAFKTRKSMDKNNQNKKLKKEKKHKIKTEDNFEKFESSSLKKSK